MYGRVIHLNPKPRWFESWWLDDCVYYFYNIKSSKKYLDDFTELSLNNLLLPPYISYDVLFQTWYFEIVGNEDISEENVYFPICFEFREHIIDWKWYRDVNWKIIEKQRWCGFPWWWNLYTIEREVIKALWETPPEYEDDVTKKFFILSETDFWWDYLWKINWNTKLSELYEKIETKEYYKKDYYLESPDALEVMVCIEILAFSYSKTELINISKDIFPGVYDFWNKYDKNDIAKNIFIKAKKLLEIIWKSKNSELRELRDDAWKILFLRKWIKQRIWLIDKILNE